MGGHFCVIVFHRPFLPGGEKSNPCDVGGCTLTRDWVIGLLHEPWNWVTAWNHGVVVEKPAPKPGSEGKLCFIYTLWLAKQGVCPVSEGQFQGDYPVPVKLSLAPLSEVIFYLNDEASGVKEERLPNLRFRIITFSQECWITSVNNSDNGFGFGVSHKGELCYWRKCLSLGKDS